MIMNQRTALVSAVVLSTFLLVVIGGIATRVTQARPTIVAPTATVLPAADVTTDPATTASTEREAAYQEALRQANQRLAKANAQIAEANRRANQDKTQIEQANAQIEQANAQIEQARQAVANASAPIKLHVPVQAAAPIVAAPAQAPAPIVPTYKVSPEQATAIAQAAANNNPMTRGPELVSYEGQVAYEVMFAPGAIYIAANSGQILFNGTTPIPSNSVAQGGGEREHENEGGDDD